MRDLLAVAGKDLRRYTRDPVALLLWLAIPMLMGTFFVLATGGDNGPKPQVQLLIADEDDSFLSRMLVGAARQGRAGEIVRSEQVDQEIGRQKMDRGEASALVVIPKGFSEAVLREKSTRLLLVTNPAQQILPGIVQEMLGMLADAVFYAHRLVGPEIRAMTEGPPRDEDIVRMSLSMSQTTRKLDRYLFPPAIQLETSIVKPPSDAQDAGLPFVFYSLPGVLMMGLLFAAQGLSDDVWKEREAGVLRRVVTTPLGIPRFLVGKLLAVIVVLAGIALVVLAAGISYVGLPWVRLPLALVWSVAVGVMLTAMMLLLQVSASSRRGASFLTFAVVMPLMMVGGSMFPFEIMPRLLASIGRWTPNGWAVGHLKAILLGTEGLLALAAGFGLMAVFAAALFVPAGIRMHRVFARR